MEAQKYWNGNPISSPADLPGPGIKPGSPALQADPLPTEALLTLLAYQSEDKMLQMILPQTKGIIVCFVC